jgi:hypothetical protein
VENICRSKSSKQFSSKASKIYGTIYQILHTETVFR